jgi:hypothetical protein
MEFTRKQLIDQLKLEILFLERGGYNPSVRKPHEEPRFFRDAVGCLNFGLEQATEPCTSCPWMEWVPPEHRLKQHPCQYIPLNAVGDTVASLDAAGPREKLRATLLAWLRKTLARLESESSAG